MKFFNLIISLFLVSEIYARPDRLSVASRELIQGTVPVISTVKLAERLASVLRAKDDEGKGEVVLLDTREKREYEVSHLSGARWVGFDDFDMGRLKGVAKNAEIVVYCSVGYRSEKVGEKLKAAGYTNVRNLFAGIFAWANEGRGLVDKKGEVTKSVHGYDAEWSKYLSSKVPRVLK